MTFYNQESPEEKTEVPTEQDGDTSTDMPGTETTENEPAEEQTESGDEVK